MEWRQFLTDNGFTLRHRVIPYGVSACIDGKVLVLAPGLPKVIEALLVWHEIGHWAMHAGPASFWKTRPMGKRTLAKMEQQAWEFSICFPEWGSGD